MGGGGEWSKICLHKCLKGRESTRPIEEGTKLAKHIYVPSIVCFGKSIVSFQSLISRHRWFAAHNERKVLSSATLTFFLINDSL